MNEQDLNPQGYAMLITLQVRDRETHKWDVVARFEYGIHAMEAARALSEGDTRTWRIVDNRFDDGPMTIVYKEGVAA
jgi:hypothetical protein